MRKILDKLFENKKLAFGLETATMYAETIKMRCNDVRCNYR